MKVLSVRKIDQACLQPDEFFVYIGNRQQVLGAVKSQGLKGPAELGHVWVDVKGKTEWQHVKLTDVIIEKKRGDNMGLKGKRETGRPTHLSAKKSAPKAAAKSAGAKKSRKSGKVDLINEDLDGQKRMPGMERRSSAKVEKQALKVYDLQTERIKIAKEEQAERAVLTRMMKDLNIPEQELPGNLIVELDQDPKAKVHKKKKGPKVSGDHASPSASGADAAATDDDDDDDE